MRKLCLLALLLSTLALGFAASISVNEFEKRVFDATNVQRQKYGLPDLKSESGLDALAQMMSRFMGLNEFFSHTDHEGNEINGRQLKYYPQLLQVAIGENLALYERSDRKFNPEEVVLDWMESPGHRENILAHEFTHLGVGVFVIGNKLYVTQNFAAPIAKIHSQLPRKFKRGKTYELEFEYLSGEPASELQLVLKLPDPKQKIKVSESMYYEGAIPLKLSWFGENIFRARFPFVGGKGIYELQAGFGGYIYADLFKFQVK